MLADIEAKLQRVKTGGHRLTPQRRRILRALAEAGRPQTAQQIHRRLVGDDPDIGLDTVYRNLRLLAALGLVNKISVARQRGDLFELAEDHHHHYLCLGCGAVACLPVCPLGEPLPALPAGGFQVVTHVFEVYGYCAACRPAAGAGEGH